MNADERGVRLRRARVDELDELTALALRSKRSNGYDEAFMAACRVELTVSAADLDEGEYWVAEAGGIRGYAALVVDVPGGVGEVRAFFVDPPHQGSGTGRALWERLLERAAANGLGELHLDADPAAVGFYRRLGLEIVGEVPSGSIAGRMLPRMAIVLDGSPWPARSG